MRMRWSSVPCNSGASGWDVNMMAVTTPLAAAWPTVVRPKSLRRRRADERSPGDGVRAAAASAADPGAIRLARRREDCRVGVCVNCGGPPRGALPRGCFMAIVLRGSTLRGVWSTGKDHTCRSEGAILLGSPPANSGSNRQNLCLCKGTCGGGGPPTGAGSADPIMAAMLAWADGWPPALRMLRDDEAGDVPKLPRLVPRLSLVTDRPGDGGGAPTARRLWLAATERCPSSGRSRAPIATGTDWPSAAMPCRCGCGRGVGSAPPGAAPPLPSPDQLRTRTMPSSAAFAAGRGGGLGEPDIMAAMRAPMLPVTDRWDCTEDVVTERGGDGCRTQTMMTYIAELTTLQAKQQRSSETHRHVGSRQRSSTADGMGTGRQRRPRARRVGRPGAKAVAP